MIHRLFAFAIASALGAGVIAACSRSEAPRMHTIRIQNFTFVPPQVTVAAGDSIVWENADFVPHSVTARDASWDSKAIAASGSWKLMARGAGRRDYYCVFHPNMKGTIIVR